MSRFNSLEEWLKWQEELHPRPIDLGLERVKSVYRALNPSAIKVPTITVAGTNGKGSTVAYLSAFYRAAGYRVGTYTSPHILRYNERIQIDGQNAIDHDICRAFEAIDLHRNEISLSYFEFSTLAALTIFMQHQVDIQILEVGLGGRLDAVNIIDPELAIITSIGIDHIEYLGNNLDSIAAEKAGIFRENIPVIVGDKFAPAALDQIASAMHAELWREDNHYSSIINEEDWMWQCGIEHIQRLPHPALKGNHQYKNASAAILATRLLSESLPVPDSAIRQGLRQATLQGRFQFIPGKKPVLLDVGHNPQAIQTLIDFIHNTYPGVRLHGVFAMMKDKDIPTVIDMMKHVISEWYLCPLQNPRAENPSLLLELLKEKEIQHIHAGYEDSSETFYHAQENAQPHDLIVIFGSFFLVSEYLAKFTPR